MGRVDAVGLFGAEQVARARRYHRPLYAAAVGGLALDLLLLALIVFSPLGGSLFEPVEGWPWWAQVVGLHRRSSLHRRRRSCCRSRSGQASCTSGAGASRLRIFAASPPTGPRRSLSASCCRAPRCSASSARRGSFLGSGLWPPAGRGGSGPRARRARAAPDRAVVQPVPPAAGQRARSRAAGARREGASSRSRRCSSRTPAGAPARATPTSPGSGRRGGSSSTTRCSGDAPIRDRPRARARARPPPRPAPDQGDAARHGRPRLVRARPLGGPALAGPARRHRGARRCRRPRGCAVRPPARGNAADARGAARRRALAYGGSARPTASRSS